LELEITAVHPASRRIKVAGSVGQLSSAFGTELRQVSSGNNGAYTAGPGWDARSGLGSPDGTALLHRLQG
jgi:hypothetical protein